MNKLVVNKDTRYVEGSTVLAPGRVEKAPLRKEEYEQLRKAQVERTNRLKHKKNLKKRKVLKTIAIVFIFGFVLTWNEGRLYTKQQQLGQIKHQINELNRDNEDLHIKLVELNGLESIKKLADEKLGMKIPEKDNIVYVDFSKSNFAEVPSDEKESLTKEIMMKIKSLLF